MDISVSMQWENMKICSLLQSALQKQAEQHNEFSKLLC